ncbi:MAG: ATP-binding protein [Candidatus Hydrothermarchaeales archaeon]
MATKEEIIREMVRSNYWWERKAVDDKDALPYRREVFQELAKALESRLITGIIGARRTGKTTLMYQLIEHLIANNVDPKRILMFTFDSPILVADREIIPKVLETYGEVYPANDRVYVFFDEIQYVKEWSRWLKGYYDRKEDVKFIVSGSSGTLLYKETSESLAGRISFYRTNPFTFFEFCSYSSKELGEVFKDLKTKDFGNLFKKETQARLEFYRPKVFSLFNKYLLYGGIPEVFGWDLKTAQKWMKSDYLGLVFYRDLLKIFEVRDVKSLEELFFFAANMHAQRINYSKIANSLNTRIETVKQYLHYLEAVNVIQIINFYSKSVKKKTRAEKKIYISDSGLRNAVLGSREEALGSEEEVSKMVEGAIASHLINRFSSEFLKDVYYWRSVYEVDFVIDLKKEALPIEVKYRSNLDAKDLKGLLSFMDRFESRRGIVITKDVLKREKIDNKEIDYIPAWLFLCIY